MTFGQWMGCSVAAMAGLACGAGAFGAAPGEANDITALQQTIEALRDDVASANARTEALERQVAAMRQASGAAAWDERRAADLRALVHDIVADADSRASLLSSDALAGWDNGFFLRSPDGNFSMKIGGQLQVRYIVNNREDAGNVVDDWESGFQLRRAKIAFSGHVYSPALTYVVQFNNNRNSGGTFLEDAIIGWRANDSVRVWAGRFQDTLGREQMMSSKRQLTVDRSAVALIFAGGDDYVEGAGVEWLVAPDHFKLSGTVNDGRGSGGGGSDFQNDGVDLAVTGRVDWKLAGEWSQGADASSWSEDQGMFLALGAGAHYIIAETGDGNTSAPPASAATGPYDDLLIWTVDGQFEQGGWGVMGAVWGMHVNATNTNPAGDVDHYAAMAQVGYMAIPDKLEPFIRYEWIDLDAPAGGVDELQFLTAGFNWYMHRHAAKFTADVVWAADPISPASTLGTGLAGAGLLNDGGSNDGDQVVGRLQFQLLF